jgi:transcriptional regulator with XRE-family HTH domain
VVAPTRRARAALSKRLREVRRAANLTGIQLAEQLGTGWGQPKISKIESGRQLPNAEDIRAWAAVTGADIDELVGLLNRASHEFRVFREVLPAVGGIQELQAALAAAEQASTTLFNYQPALVPGLLQTAEYARALLALPGGPAEHGASADEIDLMIAQRMRRASILYEPNRDVVVLVGEAALRNVIGSTQVMKRQLDHLVQLAETLPHARVGVIPFTKCPIAPLHGWQQRDDLIIIETIAGSLDIADPVEVEQYRRWAGHLMEAAVFDSDVAALALPPTK